MGEELFTTTELTSFGNYLLSAERTRSILNSDMEGDPLRLLANVHHADFENWKALHGEAGVAIPQTYIGDTYLRPNSEEAEALRQQIVKEWAESRRAGVAISEGPSQQPEKPRTVVLVDTPLVL